MRIEGIIPNGILEEPSAIRATVGASEHAVLDIASHLQPSGVNRVWLIGNGTSYHSALHAARLMRRLAGPGGPTAIPLTAGEFVTFRPQLASNDALVGISASGEFRDVVTALDQIRGKIPSIAVVHVPGSSLTRVADHVVLSSGGRSHSPVMTKTFAATLSAASLLVAALIGEDASSEVAQALMLAADHVEQTLLNARAIAEQVATEFAKVEHVFVVGGGLAFPAALESALKLKEMALIHAEASETWEMASGPSTMVNANTLVISLAPNGPARAATDDIVGHCRRWGAHVMEVAPSRAVDNSSLFSVPDDVDERFSSLTLVPPVALFAYVLATLRGATPDQPHWVQRYFSQGLTHIEVPSRG